MNMEAPTPPAAKIDRDPVQGLSTVLSEGFLTLKDKVEQIRGDIEYTTENAPKGEVTAEQTIEQKLLKNHASYIYHLGRVNRLLGEYDVLSEYADTLKKMGSKVEKDEAVGAELNTLKEDLVTKLDIIIGSRVGDIIKAEAAVENTEKTKKPE